MFESQELLNKVEKLIESNNQLVENQEKLKRIIKDLTLLVEKGSTTVSDWSTLFNNYPSYRSIFEPVKVAEPLYISVPATTKTKETLDALMIYLGVEYVEREIVKKVRKVKEVKPKKK